jgi:Beta-sandwich domain in beta galactosidase
MYAFTFYFQAHVFQPQSGGCAAFLANYNTKSFARVMFNNRNYNLPPWSISILPDCTNVVFNTAKVNNLTRPSVMFTCKLQATRIFF